MSSSSFPAAGSTARLLNRVAEITIFFWLVKVLATTVGETAADFLNITLGFGLNGTSLVMSGLLALGSGGSSACVATFQRSTGY